MPMPGPSFTFHRYHDPLSFEAAAQPFLLEREASHCLQLGLISGLKAGEWRDPFLAVVEGGGETALVAMRTPPHKLVLSHTDDLAALEPLLELDHSLDGVLGPKEVADAFAAAWSRARGVQAELAFRQRIYRLERVAPPFGVPGRQRPATDADRRLLEEWMGAFMREALPGTPSDAATTVGRFLSSPDRELWLWELEGEPVSMAGAGSRTPNGIRISAVYTPPANRSRGFASALVAELSRRQLNQGRTFCFLFTDLANPTSNHIYQQLGFEPVGDAHEYDFRAD